MPPRKDGGEAGEGRGDAGAASGEPVAAPAAGWSFNIFAPLGMALENGFESGLDACAPESNNPAAVSLVVP
jgi:hypothetical protein